MRMAKIGQKSAISLSGCLVTAGYAKAQVMAHKKMVMLRPFPWEANWSKAPSRRVRGDAMFRTMIKPKTSAICQKIQIVYGFSMLVHWMQLPKPQPEDKWGIHLLLYSPSRWSTAGPFHSRLHRGTWSSPCWSKGTHKRARGRPKFCLQLFHW